MIGTRIAWLLPLVVLLGGCERIEAAWRSHSMSAALWALPQYRAQTTEYGVLPGREAVGLVREVTFQHPYRVRFETIAPEDRAGDVYVYDGYTVSYWWPAEHLGVRVRHVGGPDQAGFRDIVGNLVRFALHDYVWQRSRADSVAGRPTKSWQASPMSFDAEQQPYQLWLDAEYELPLQINVLTNTGQPWYRLEYTRFDAGRPVGAADFTMAFPPDAVVIDWDLDAPAVTAEQATRLMNFTLRSPRALPSGYTLRKTIRSRSGVPMTMMVLESGQERLLLSENRYLGAKPYRARVGRSVRIGDQDGYAVFLGAMTMLRWCVDDTELSLSGVLPLPQLVAIAQSVR